RGRGGRGPRPEGELGVSRGEPGIDTAGAGELGQWPRRPREGDPAGLPPFGERPDQPGEGSMGEGSRRRRRRGGRGRRGPGEPGQALGEQVETAEGEMPADYISLPVE